LDCHVVEILAVKGREILVCASHLSGHHFFFVVHEKATVWLGCKVSIDSSNSEVVGGFGEID
jgi:hypothetical protein